MDYKKEKFLVFFCGLVLALILLELVLRSAGSFNRQHPFLAISGGKNNHIILCLGNSVTYGLGAPKGQSYPDYLQKLFNQYDKKKNLLVVNRGICNLNTSELLNKLEFDLNLTHPQVVVLQTGSPNSWNMHYYYEYLKRRNKRNLIPEKLFLRLNDFLYRSRVYRLILLLWSNLKDKLDYASRLAPGNPVHYSQQEKEEYQQAYEYWYQLILAYFNKETPIVTSLDLERMSARFKKRIKSEPHNPVNYRYIGDIYYFSNKFEEAADWYIGGVDADPGYRGESDMNYNYDGLKTILRTTADQKIKKKITDFIERFKQRNRKNYEEFIDLKAEDVLEWVEFDVREIIRTIRDRKIQVVLQNYPPTLPERKQYLESLNARLRKIADELNVPFVDNEKVFQEKMEKNGGRAAYFNDGPSGAGHCNAQGYQLMALNVYDTIKLELF